MTDAVWRLGALGWPWSLVVVAAVSAVIVVIVLERVLRLPLAALLVARFVYFGLLSRGRGAWLARAAATIGAAKPWLAEREASATEIPSTLVLLCEGALFESAAGGGRSDRLVLLRALRDLHAPPRPRWLGRLACRVSGARGERAAWYAMRLALATGDGAALESFLASFAARSDAVDLGPLASEARLVVALLARDERGIDKAEHHFDRLLSRGGDPPWPPLVERLEPWLHLLRSRGDWHGVLAVAERIRAATPAPGRIPADLATCAMNAHRELLAMCDEARSPVACREHRARLYAWSALLEDSVRGEFAASVDRAWQ